MSVKYKGATKRCCYGACKNDFRRITSKSMKSYFFIKFPKPCISYRHGLLDCGKRKHINMCRQCKKSELWVKYCRRADDGLKSIDHVTKDTYICSLHFHGKNGPTEAYPNPIDHAKSNNATIVSIFKKIKTHVIIKSRRKVWNNVCSITKIALKYS